MTLTESKRPLGYGFSQDHFGGSTTLRENPQTTTVGTTPTILLANNPERIAWQIVNRDVAAIGVGFSQGVTVSNAITIAPGGGMLSAVIEDDGELVTFPVFAVSAAGGATVYVVEVFKG